MSVPTSDPLTSLLPSLGSRLHKMWFVDIAIAVFMTVFGAHIFTLEPYGLQFNSWLGGGLVGIGAFAFGVAFAVAWRLDEVSE